MITLLAVQSCSSCSPALLRHWDYFQRQKADIEIVIVTEDKPCQVPPGVKKMAIGVDKYLDAEHLPSRLLNTIASLLQSPWDTLIMCEYDTVIFNRIKVEEMNSDVSSHLAGQRESYRFFHNPWLFKRDAAIRFVDEGRKVIAEGKCTWNSAESSPDVFFGTVCDRLKLWVGLNLWTQYSRNSLDVPGHLEEAREAYRGGVDVIHGIKTAKELEFITA
jgi:hypothetical protein